MCVKELLSDYDDYLASDGLVKDTPQSWIKPRLRTLRKVFEIIDARFDELMQVTGKKLTAMEKSGDAPSNGSEIYHDYCLTIDKIREQYILYNETVKAFAQAIGTEEEGDSRKQLEQSMTHPEGWILQTLMSDSEWQQRLNESQNPDS